MELKLSIEVSIWRWIVTYTNDKVIVAEEGRRRVCFCTRVGQIECSINFEGINIA